MEDYSPEEAFNEICEYFLGSDIMNPKYKRIDIMYYKSRVDLVKQVAEDGLAIPVKIAKLASSACVVLAILCILLSIIIIVK